MLFYWFFGFYICRWGYGDLMEMKKVYERNILVEILFVSDNDFKGIIEKIVVKVYVYEN